MNNAFVVFPSLRSFYAKLAFFTVFAETRLVFLFLCKWLFHCKSLPTPGLRLRTGRRISAFDTKIQVIVRSSH